MLFDYNYFCLTKKGLNNLNTESSLMALKMAIKQRLNIINRN
jgi:hypothetical protein